MSRNALILNDFETRSGGDGRSVVGGGFDIGLLDSEAASEWARNSVIAASNRADISGWGAAASEVGGEGEGHVEIGGANLRKTVGSWDVVGDGYSLGDDTGVT